MCTLASAVVCERYDLVTPPRVLISLVHGSSWKEINQPCDDGILRCWVLTDITVPWDYTFEPPQQDDVVRTVVG